MKGKFNKDTEFNLDKWEKIYSELQNKPSKALLCATYGEFLKDFASNEQLNDLYLRLLEIICEQYLESKKAKLSLTTSKIEIINEDRLTELLMIEEKYNLLDLKGQICKVHYRKDSINYKEKGNI